MSKRKLEEKIAVCQAKLKKIEESRTRTRFTRILLSDSSDSEEDSCVGATPLDKQLPTEEITPHEQVLTHLSPGLAQQTENVAEGVSATSIVPVSSEPEAKEEPPQLDPEILSALGAKTDDDPEYGEKIHENLSQLWLPLLKKGMNKEDKEKNIKDYLVPQNCPLLQAPKLNLEISAAISESARQRDKKMKSASQQLGVGITGINRAMDALLDSSDSKLKAIKHLSNACRVLCDLHFMNSQTRIKCITPTLDKIFINVINDTQRDEMLFGNKLADKIKSSKTIEKQGLQIKKTPATTMPTASTSRAMTSNRGNWSAPSRYLSTKNARGGIRKNSAPYKAPQLPAAPAKPTSKLPTRAQARH